MFSSPKRGFGPSPKRKKIPEGPIRDFASVIENTIAEEWHKRTSAFTALVAAIPSGSDYSEREAWFNSPLTLRHLAFPLSELLKDARSTVVKRTCESCSALFSKCQIDARYLLKDIMPTILALHAQTVQVIRIYAQDMTVEAFSFVPCKMAMPLLLDRLKSDKSRTVRDACCLYLGTGLSEWSADESYLTLEIWEKVGTALVTALHDRSPEVRKNAKKGLETVHQQRSEIIAKLLQNKDLTRDMRVKKVLQRIEAGEVVGDDVSVGSSRAGSASDRNHRSHRGAPNYQRSSPRALTTKKGVPKTIGGSADTPEAHRSHRGAPRYQRPPPRTPTSNKAIPQSIGAPADTPEAPPRRMNRPAKGGGLGPPVRTNAPFKAAMNSPSTLFRKVDQTAVLPTPASDKISADVLPPTASDKISADGASRELPKVETGPGESFNTLDSIGDTLPSIGNASELRKFAKSRSNSRRSSLLQERFSRSSLNFSSQDSQLLKTEEDGDIKQVNPQPEHLTIATELLEAHKRHVDQIMETLKIEMDAMKGFEMVLLEEGPQRPTEDEVLEYFESVGLCLEQRNKAGARLQRNMDRISQGK